MHFMADFQTIEYRRQHAILMKINFPPIGRLKKTIILDRKNLDDAGERRRLVDFYLAALAPRMVLQVAPGGVEGIADRDLDIFVGRMLARLVELGEILLRFFAVFQFRRRQSLRRAIDH